MCMCVCVCVCVSVCTFVFVCVYVCVYDEVTCGEAKKPRHVSFVITLLIDICDKTTCIHDPRHFSVSHQFGYK